MLSINCSPTLRRGLLAATLLALPFSVLSAAFYSGSKAVPLVELYTSEGCSSCPPAERYVSSFKQDKQLWQDFVPVAFHVDYWDYLGWNDPWASADYSNRQRQYRRQGNTKSVYTPQFVVAGQEWRQFFRGPRVLPKPETAAGELTLHVDGRQFRAEFDQQGQWQLNIALLAMDRSSRVRAGENRGKTLNQDFVVLAHKTLTGSRGATTGAWSGTLPALPSGEQAQAIAAWVSRKSDLTPVQAVGGEL